MRGREGGWDGGRGGMREGGIRGREGGWDGGRGGMREGGREGGREGSEGGREGGRVLFGSLYQIGRPTRKGWILITEDWDWELPPQGHISAAKAAGYK